jgi:hypothetical protein
MDSDDPGWEKLESFLGVDREDLVEMDAEELYVTWQEALVEKDPEGWRRAQAGFRALRVEKLTIEGDQATIDCPPVAEYKVHFNFRREEGEWRFAGAGEFGPMKFRPRERKLAAFLPKSPDYEGVGVVVEVGDDSLPGETVEALARHLRDLGRFYGEPGRELPAVLLEVHPELPMQDFMKILDLPHAHGFHDVAFSDTTETIPPPGVRLNGIPLDEIGEVTSLPDALQRPALERVIGVGAEFSPSRRIELLRDVRERRREK